MALRDQDPKHEATRKLLRFLGPTIAGAGLLFMAVGLFSFFGSFGTGEFPKYFWGMFVGMPLLFVGLVLSKFAFLGAVMKYAAHETAPVGKDVVNYMASGTRGAVRELASAAREGFLNEPAAAADACPKCRAPLADGANFCSSCGTAMTAATTCGKCGRENESDARFCAGCGQAMAQR
ncbi:MAG TPA: zinc ribbon domain-containing protein [Planctomycetia bacterium]|nr:zinc ribbon domain-containing protein [Planctomycetia bacterium]